MNNTTTKPKLPAGFYFMAVGPLVGFALVIACLIIVAIPELYESNRIDVIHLFQISLAILIYGFFVAYLVGMLPALITGVISSKGKTNAQQIRYAVISGAASCLVLSLPFQTGWAYSLGTAVLGALSGLGCILLRQRKLKRLNR